MTDVQEFAQAFRGYDKEQVDQEIARLRSALEQSRTSAKAAAQDAEAESNNHRDDMQAAERRITNLEADLIEAQSRLKAAESRAELLGKQATSGDDEHPARFQEVLRVAEEQASALIENAVAQADRIVADAKKQIAKDRAAAEAEAQRIRESAKHDEAQAKLRVETERTAHVAEVEQREATLGEKVARAESEASVLVTEAERATAALRHQTTQEAEAMKTEAERILRDARNRELELDSAAKRRQDEAQQEFLRVHKQAIAHAERITSDANEKVASALQHATHIQEQAQAFEDLAKAQALHIERQAAMKANAILSEARGRAQTIVEHVLSHSKDVLHEAEDRARTLRFQQQQLTGFRAELNQLMQIAEQTRSSLPAMGSDVASAAPDVAPAVALDADEAEELGLDDVIDSDVDQAAETEESAAEIAAADVAVIEPIAAEDRDIAAAPEVVVVEPIDDLADLELELASEDEAESGIVSEPVEVVWHADNDRD